MTDKQIEKAWDELDIYNHMFKDKKWTDEEYQIFHELMVRKMINSCLTYDTPYLHSNYYQEDVKKVGEKRVMELYQEQLEDFKKAKVYKNVHTDFEGVTYNAVLWADE